MKNEDAKNSVFIQNVLSKQQKSMFNRWSISSICCDPGVLLMALLADGITSALENISAMSALSISTECKVSFIKI